MVATKKPKTGMQPTRVTHTPLETDDELLAISLSFASRIAGMKDTGASDEELLIEIKQRWRQAPVQTKKPYGVVVDHAEYGTAIWFGVLTHRGKAPDTVPSLSTFDGSLGSGIPTCLALLPNVRRVLGIAQSSPDAPRQESRAQPKPATNGKPKPPSKKLKSSAEPMGIKLGPVEQRPVEWFHESPWQERATDESAIDELADSMGQWGQLEPVVALPTGELISGHTRWLAAPRAKPQLTHLDVRIVDVDDATAQALVLFYNIKRKDLSLRERCKHFNKLLASYKERGLTQSDLAEELGIDGSTLSNELRLASLPDSLWEKQEAGGFTIEQSRRLAVHADRPEFVAGVLGHLKTIGCELHVQPEPHHFESVLSRGIGKAYRPMEKDAYGEGCLFKPNAIEREQLEIVEVERGSGKVEMAANIPLWNKLNGEAKRKLKQKEEAARIKAEEAAPATGAAKAKQSADTYKREAALSDAWDIAFAQAISARFSGKLKKVDSPIVQRLAMFTQLHCTQWDQSTQISPLELIAEEAEFQARCLELVTQFFNVEATHPQRGWASVSSESLRQLARWLEVTPLEHWRPTATLLDTCDDKELIEFLKDHDQLPATKRQENLKQLLTVWQPGNVPHQFVLDKPQTKSRKK